MKATTDPLPAGTKPRRTLRDLYSYGRRLGSRYPKRILIGCIAIAMIALALPHLYTFYLSARWPIPEIDHRSESGFLSLMYIANETDDDDASGMSPARFRRHLAEMTEAGYTFIGLHDVQRLMREGIPLPSQSVLIGVDYRGSTRGWDAWKLAVVQTRARAVLFIDPDRPQRPAWRVLRQTAATPHWDIAATYHAVAADPSLADDLALDNSQTTATHYNRLHKMDQTAVRQHRRFRTVMRAPFPSPVMALLYPYTPSNSEHDANHDIKRHLLARNAPPFFELGFVAGELAFNTRQSDRFFLNSRIVPSEWSERDLAQRLRTYREIPFETADTLNIPQRAAWTTIFGSPGIEDGHMVLQSKTGDVTGLWLAGSDTMKAFEADIRFSMDHGILRIPFMAAADESSRWELRLSSDGRIALLRSRWQYTHEIARAYRRFNASQESRLRITQRNDQLWIALDGQPLFGGLIPMNEPATTGLIGIRLSSADNMPASATIAAFSVTPPSTTIALLDGPREHDAYGIRWMGRQAHHLTAVSPPLNRISSTGSVSSQLIRQTDLIETAARIHGWDVIPHVTLKQSQALNGWTPEQVLTLIESTKSDGILFRLDDGAHWPESRLVDWGRNLAETLKTRGYRLLIRLPMLATGPMPVTASLGRVPDIQWVTTVDGTPDRQRGDAVEIRVPAPDSEVDLQMVYDLFDTDRDRSADDERQQLQHQRDQAEALYGRGEYEDAISLWFDWHERAPGHPTPLRRIGDALQRLGYHTESIEFYRQSLDRDPGNIDLAILMADWLDATGKHDEARNLLFTYDLLFPNHPSILLAQAIWFHRHKHFDQSRSRVERLLEQRPDHFKGLLIMAQLAPDASQRRSAMEHLLRVTETPEQRRQILQGIRDADLLVLPEAEVLLPLLNRAAADDDSATAKILDQLRPRDTMTTATAETLPTQTAWRVDGGTLQTERGRIRVKADPGREDVLLRLNGTERWHDVFVEADLAEQRGEFWLTARRSHDHMIRFGFDADGESLRLQVWRIRDGESRLLNNQSHPWRLPEGGARLRLEVRGSGATGYIDGEPWGVHAVALAEDISPGWVAFSARSINPGNAEMTLRRISAGPIFPVVARFDEPRESGKTDRLAERLHGLTSQINTLSPSGFSIDANGRWSSVSDEKNGFSRLFARYHAFRLAPHVQVDPAATLHAANILQASAVHQTDGFVLEFDQPPDKNMIDKLDRDLGDLNIHVILLIHRNGSINMRGIGRSRLLLPGETGEPRLSISASDTPEARAELRDARQHNPVLIEL